MKKYKYDIYRYYGKYNESLKEKLSRTNGLRYILLLRKINDSYYLKFFYKYKLAKLSRKTLIEISYKTKIGKGFYIGHGGNIIINKDVTIGNNCNITNGATIGQENRGVRKGVPIIGDDVWIGANSVIVGKVKIGNDVLIAPNTYVNFDVPDHSVVIGNPGKIINKKNATECYINKKV